MKDLCDVIKNFPAQFAYAPLIKGGDFSISESVIVVGMGGSNHATILVKMLCPERAVIIHRDYGLPHLPEKILERNSVVLSSYSGNTEEVLDAYSVSGIKNLPRVAISTGGKLLERAKKDNIPYIELPIVGIEPRSAVGYMLVALLNVLGEEKILQEVVRWGSTFQPSAYENRGRKLAEELEGYVPIVYSSLSNEALAYNWKIRFHETAKIPAFYNVFPELNHNEINGFDVQKNTKKLSQNLCVLFLQDSGDSPKIQKRMETTEKLYRDRGIKTLVVDINDASLLEKIFSSIILADWVTYYLAKHYGIDPEETPMVEEFKKMIRIFQ